MLNFDSLREIWATIRKNKMRTFLTGISIAWGIFMLIVLLGAGNGFRNGVKSNFSDRDKNTIFMWPGTTSKPFNGLSKDRELTFTLLDYNLIKNQLPGVQYISPRLMKSDTISYKKQYGSWRLCGVSADYSKINEVKIDSGCGRNLNEMDDMLKRKVIVISKDTREVLFKKENPLGKYVSCGNILFEVVGVYTPFEQNDNPPSYIPFTVAQTLYSGGYGFQRIDFTVLGLNTKEDNDNFEKIIRSKMGALHLFDPEDKSALYIRNTSADTIQTNTIFNGITLFIWIIGIASMMAGIVGVGNIMLITVKERTKEIGVRKAIGASPRSILKLIIFESILITGLFGYLGMMVGVALMQFISSVLPQTSSGHRNTVFLNPTVNIGIVIAATLLLVISGTLAGLIPATKAVKIRPIEAMRAD